MRMFLWRGKDPYQILIRQRGNKPIRVWTFSKQNRVFFGATWSVDSTSQVLLRFLSNLIFRHTLEGIPQKENDINLSYNYFLNLTRYQATLFQTQKPAQTTLCVYTSTQSIFFTWTIYGKICGNNLIALWSKWSIRYILLRFTKKPKWSCLNFQS